MAFLFSKLFPILFCLWREMNGTRRSLFGIWLCSSLWNPLRRCSLIFGGRKERRWWSLIRLTGLAGVVVTAGMCRLLFAGSAQPPRSTLFHGPRTRRFLRSSAYRSQNVSEQLCRSFYLWRKFLMNRHLLRCLHHLHMDSPKRSNSIGWSITNIQISRLHLIVIDWIEKS